MTENSETNYNLEERKMKKYQLFASIVAVSLLTIGFGSFEMHPLHIMGIQEKFKL